MKSHCKLCLACSLLIILLSPVTAAFGAIIEVEKDGDGNYLWRQSGSIGSRHADRLLVYPRTADTDPETVWGLNRTTGVYVNGGPYGENGWTSTEPLAQQWVAFKLDDPAGINSLALWNLGATGDNAYRNLSSFDIYVSTDPDFSPVTGKLDYDFSGADFTKINSSPLSLASQYQYAQYFNVNLPADTQWVFLASLEPVGPYTSGTNVTGIGKVAFTDHRAGFTPQSVNASSDRFETDRNHANLTSENGLRPNPFGGDRYVYGSASSWLSYGTDASQQWLAFDLGDSIDLDGMYVWNYAQAVLESERGVKDFRLYLITETDVAKLAAKGINTDFDTLFADGRSNSDILDDLDLAGITSILNPGAGADSPDPTLFTLQKSGATYSDQQDISFSLAEDVMWVLMDIQSNFGGHDALVGLEHVQFLEGTRGGSDSAVPEPATWAMLLLGVVGMAICRRRNRHDGLGR